ncbi:MAG: acetylornithine deacetylase [Rubricella sp.]
MPTSMDTRAILQALVAFPTVSDRTNLPMIDWIEAYLADHGVAARRVEDRTEPKASLYAMVGPDAPGGTILSGHSDVVPVDGQPWTMDPWTLTERDGRLHGRGTTDMKGFLACVLSAVPAMVAAPMKRPIQIAISYDEEIGCEAAPPLIAAMGQVLPPAAACIVGEPTGLRVVSGHKGIAVLETRVRGHEVHSSLIHRGVSAISFAAKLITWLDAQTAANSTQPGDPAFDPPYTTLHTGLVRGGTAHNITARDCVFETDIRAMPGEPLDGWIDRYRAEAQALETGMRLVSPDAGVDIRTIASVVGCSPEPRGAAGALARRLTGDNGEHRVAYATEAGHFQSGGISTVVCGPGDIAQAHQPDEWIAVDQLSRCDAFIARLIEDHCR